MNRYDFVYLFEVTNGNPNGDPDAGNLPRIDPETQHGIVTDVCIKRKIRNFVTLAKAGQKGFNIYVREKAILNDQHLLAYEALKIKSEAKKMPKDVEDAKRLTGWMCQNFYDIRTFGAVMTTEVNCGQVRGPVQFAMAHSIDPILSQEHAITRCAVATKREAEEQQGDNRTMGRKFTVPYALYRCHGFINANLAGQTGFGEADLDLLWQALAQMWDQDRSAARGEMAPRRLFVFRHDSALGNAPAHRLFETIRIERKDGSRPPRSFNDYQIVVGRDLPAGVELIERF